MRFYNNKIGYKIIDIVYELEPNGIGRNKLVRLSGYAKDTIDEWLNRLRNFGFIRLYPKYPVRLTEDAIQKYNIKNLIIPQDPNSEKFKKIQQRKQFIKRELGKNYAEIIILILCLAAFGSIKPTEYKKPKLGLMVVPDPSNAQQTYMYGTNTKQSSPAARGVGLNDLIDKLPTNKSSYSPNKKAVLPKYYTNYGNNELFGYLKLSQNNAQNFITLLSEKYNILSPIKGKQNSETRYEISDKLLNKFAKQCILAFNSDIDQRLEYAYTYDFLDKKQKKEYFNFLNKWYGRGRKYSNVRSYLVRSKDIKIDNISKNHYRKYINECDTDIFDYGLFEPDIEKCGYDKYKLIIGKKYKPLQEKYPLIVDIFFDILFPQFLRKIWYDQESHQVSSFFRVL